MTDYFIANNLVPVDTFASCAGCTMNLVQDTSVDNPTGDATVQSVLNKFKDYTKNVPYYLNPSINVRGFFGWYAPHAGYVMWAVSKSGTYFCIDSTTQRVYDKGTSAGIFWTCN